MSKEANKERWPRYCLARARLEYVLRYGNEDLRARLYKLLKELVAREKAKGITGGGKP